jgi:predicted TIM-barrel fold metal-dependent hydrolase
LSQAGTQAGDGAVIVLGRSLNCTAPAPAFLYPDVRLCGGITGAKKIAAMAEANDCMVVPNNPLSLVSTAACLQIAACIPNFAIQEDPTQTPDLHGTSNILGSGIATGLAEPRDGFMPIPNGPGIGVELVPDAVARWNDRGRFGCGRIEMARWSTCSCRPVSRYKPRERGGGRLIRFPSAAAQRCRTGVTVSTWAFRRVSLLPASKDKPAFGMQARAHRTRAINNRPCAKDIVVSEVLQRPSTERTIVPAGAIDCDVHISVPGMKALLPYMSQAWQEMITSRGTDGLELASYPPGAPLSCRPDWRPLTGKPGTDLAILQRQALDAFGTRIAIANCLHGGQAVHSEDLAQNLCQAVNEWLVADWLDQEPRLRASIVVPTQNPVYAAQEIERCAGDKRFVQVQLLAAGEMLLGRRYYWPIYEAAVKHDLPIGIHAGSAFRHAPTSNGWPSHFVQDYVGQTMGFEAQLLSLMGEGVFNHFPTLRVVLIESGVTWLPAFLWRAIKSWRGLRSETPWFNRSPAELVRQHVRLTMQPFDAPGSAEVERILEHIGGDEMLLFATDFPHWHFDGTQALPPGLSPELVRRLAVDNPLATYPRLQETLS